MGSVNPVRSREGYFFKIKHLSPLLHYVVIGEINGARSWKQVEGKEKEDK